MATNTKTKILIGILIILIIICGILAWQYLGIPQQEEKKILKERKEVTPELVEPSKETIQIKLYFSNNKLGEGKCESAFPVIRTIPQAKKIEEMAKIAINELIKGPTKEEKLQGYYLTGGFPSKENIERHKKRMEEKGLETSAFDDGVKVKNLEIKDGIAYVDFNIALNVGGNAIESCIITSVRTAVANTLKQFPEIKDIIITVEGREWPCSDFDCVRKLEFEVGKSDIFIETARPGEGITHLARRALDKYLKQVSYIEEIELTEEQKVYIEDYLQNKIGSESLRVGESKEFSAELIREAIIDSQSITQQELKKYLFPTSIKAGVIQNPNEQSAIVWIQYLDRDNKLIRDAKVALIEEGLYPNEKRYDAKFSAENNYYYVTFYYSGPMGGDYAIGCCKVSAEKEIYASQYKDLGCLRFYTYKPGVEQIQTGEFPINYEGVAKIQKSVDEGHQPWYLSPQIVAFDMARNYGFIEEDRETMKNIMLDTNTGIAKYEIIHKEKSYIITVIQPVPGEHKVWTLLEIKLKELVEDETANWKTYRNEEYGFEIKYPSDIFTEKTVTEKPLPPFYTEEFSGLKLIHSIPIQHCGLSGLPEDCEPETQDITIGFFPINKNFQDITIPIKNIFGNGYLKELIVSGKTGTTFELGAEGEGVFYYLIPLNQYKTLLIRRSYISEKTVIIYQGVKDFIPIAEQEKLFNQMLSTFRFLE